MTPNLRFYKIESKVEHHYSLLHNGFCLDIMNWNEPRLYHAPFPA